MKWLITQIKEIEKKKKVKFNVRNLFEEKKKYDYVICNGIFTLKSTITNQKMLSFIKRCINQFYKISIKGFAFNVMDEKVDFKSKDLFYTNSDKLLSFLKNKQKIKIKIDSKTIVYENCFFIKKTKWKKSASSQIVN